MRRLKKTLGVIASRIDSMSRFFGLVTGVFILFIVLVETFEVVMRYVFDMPTIWALDISKYLFAYTVYLAASYTQLMGGHVRVDLVTIRLPIRARNVFKVVTGVIGLIFCGFFVWGGWEQALAAHLLGYRSGTMFDFPLFPVMVIIPIGIFFLSLQLLVSIGRAGTGSEKSEGSI